MASHRSTPPCCRSPPSNPMAVARAISLICYTPLRPSPPHAVVSKYHTLPRFPSSDFRPLVSSFTPGFPSAFWTASKRTKVNHEQQSVSIRCEQGTKANSGLDVWLGRLAMVGFATAITVEICTGKGLLENFGFTTPMPTLALIVTALVAVLTAFFIFQSASQD